MHKMDDDLPTDYDVIVIGTGLVESIVAAAVSRIGKKVLHLDKNSYYGKSWGTFSFESFEQWLQNVCNPEVSNIEEKLSNTLENQTYYKTRKNNNSIKNIKWEWFIPDGVENVTDQQQVSSTTLEETEVKKTYFTKENLKKLSQKFNIDLSPRILFSKGPMVEALIRSGVSRYTEFVNVHNILLYFNSTIESVPYSKSDIFSSRSVTVVEKRILMKLLQEIQSLNDETIEDEQFKNETFCEYLQKFQIPENIEKYIIHCIARVSKKSPCVDGINHAKYFLNSLGVYGNSPFLWPLYGSSELVQAFCRLCAVYGGVYCLSRGADQIIVEKSKCIGVISDNKQLLAEHIVMSSMETPIEFLQENKMTETITRGILFTDKTIYSSGKKGTSLLNYPCEDSCQPPITVIELDNSTLACPNSLRLVHLIKKERDEDYKEFDNIVKELFAPCKQKEIVIPNDNETISDENKPNVLFKLFFTVEEPISQPSDKRPSNFYTCRGPLDPELDFFAALKEAESIFSKMYPGEEFLPLPQEHNEEE